MDPYYRKRELAVQATTISFDIITDLMSKSISPVPERLRILTCLVLVIPPWLLWKVKISLRQKIGIGSFLCLSLIMIIIAVIRISRVHASDFDIWAFFLQQLEACISVLMLSLTALRTLYVSAKRTQEQQRNKIGYSTRKRFWPSSKKLQDEPYIQLDMPNTALTGMRTLVVSNQSTSWPTKHEDGQDLDPHFDKVSFSIWFSSGTTNSSLNTPFRYDPQPSTLYKVSEGRLQVHEILITSLLEDQSAHTKQPTSRFRPWSTLTSCY